MAAYAPGTPAPSHNRWLQLFLGIVCMAMVANLQYGWTLFVAPINEKYHWGRASIQVAFSVFVLLEKWLVPFESWVVDRFGPRIVVMVGGVLVGIAWVVNAYASSLALLYVGAALGGIGAGAVYGTCVGNALKWFPDRRGLAAGLTAAGFGAGSALTIIPIQAIIHSNGYEAAFLYFGIIQGVVVFLLAFGLAAPRKGEVPEVAKVALTRREYSWKEMLGTPTFWVMYVMFVLMAMGGLMATAQLGPIAKDFKIADTPVDLLGLTLPALTFALTIDRVLNGVTRPFFGWISDHIGREPTMFIAFLLEGVGIIALAHLGTDPFWFVVLSGAVFFAWGEIYSLFPATCTDTYGSRYATTNSGLLYTAKGTASLIVPLANVLAKDTGNWHAVFYIAAGMNLVAAAMAIGMLRPMRMRQMQKAGAETATPAPRDRLAPAGD